VKRVMLGAAKETFVVDDATHRRSLTVSQRIVTGSKLDAATFACMQGLNINVLLT
jgi:hypothetical protein